MHDAFQLNSRDRVDTRRECHLPPSLARSSFLAGQGQALGRHRNILFLRGEELGMSRLSLVAP